MGKKICLVPGCQNASGSLNEDGNKVTLHRFPIGEARKHIRKQWITVLKNVRSNLIVNDNSRICSEHFEGGYTKTAIPTIFKCKPKPEVKKRRHLLRNSINLQDFEDDQLDPESNLPENLEGLNENLLSVCDETIEFDQISKQQEASECDSNERIPENAASISTPVEKMLNVSNNGDGIGKMKHSESCNKSTVKPEMIDVGIQVNLPSMTYEDLKGNDDKTRFYTGFVGFKVFWIYFCTLLKHGADNLNYWEGEKRSMGEKSYQNLGFSKPGKKRFLRPVDEFLMVCMRLRLGLLQEHLADIFCVSESTVSRIMNTWINFLYDHCKSMIAWPTREQILSNLPRLFYNHPDTTVIIDCTEFFTEKPSSLVAQWLTWSEYKHSNTFKVLIGVAPNGMVTFISRLWGGNASDRHITKNDSFLPKLSPGDVIMADKGFTIEDLLPPNVGLNVPPRVSSKTQMSNTEFFKTNNIASSRIVVEMKMEQIKNFRILASVIPLSEAHLSEQTIFICTAWTNLLPPLLK